MKRKLFFIIGKLLFLFISVYSQDSLKLVLPIGHTLKLNKVLEINGTDYLVTSSDDFTCKIWGKRSGKLIADLKGHSNRITSLDYSRPNNEIITGSNDSSICFWRISTKGIQSKFIKTSKEVNSFTQDSLNQLLYVLEGDCKITTWDLKKHKILNQVTYVNYKFSSLKYDYDEKKIIILSWNGVIYTSKTPIVKNLVKLKGHENYINNLLFGNDKYKFTSSWDGGDIIKWRISDNKILSRYKVSNQIINDFKLVNNDSIILAATIGKKLIVYNTYKNKILKEVDFNDWVMSVSVNDSQTVAAISSKDGEIKLLDIKSLTVIKSLRLYNKIQFSQYVNNSRDLICSFSNGTTIVLDAISLIKKFDFNKNNLIPSNTLVNNEGVLISANQTDGSYSLLDIKNGYFLNRKSKVKGIVDLGYPNKEGDILMVFGNVVKLWNTKGHYFSRQKDFGNETVVKAGFSSSKKIPYVILRDLGLYILDENTLEPIEKYSRIGYPYFVNVEIIANDEKIIIGDTEGNLNIFNRNSDEKINLSIDDDNADDNGEIIYIKEIKKNILCAVSQHVITLIDLKTNALLKRFKSSHISDAKIQNNLLYVSHYDGQIDIWDLDKFKLLKKNTTENSVININTSENLIFTTAIDGKISCKNLNNFEKKFILYFLKDGNYIIKLYNSNFYMCSKDASKMLHYVTKDLRIIDFEQLDPIYNRPDIVLDSLGIIFKVDNKYMVNEYHEAYIKRIKKLGLTSLFEQSNELELPSTEIINSDLIKYENIDGLLTIKIKCTGKKFDLKNYNIFVNEVPLFGSNGVLLDAFHTKVFTTDVSIKLSGGLNKIVVTSMNIIGLGSLKYPIYVNYTPSFPIKERTYFIGIGVDKFNSLRPELEYCKKDILDLKNKFLNDPNLYSIILLDSEVNIHNLLKIKETLDKTTIHDKVIFSCSSHGLLDENNNFYLAMYNTDMHDLKNSAIPFSYLEFLLDSIPARKKLLLLDACNSGENEILRYNLINNKFDAMKKEYLTSNRGYIFDEDNANNSFNRMLELFVNINNFAGTTIISAAGGKQNALEGNAVIIDGKPIENGAFTYSILEYINNFYNSTEKYTVNQLKNYVENRVVELTKGKQRPTSRNENLDSDWDLH